MKFLESPCQLRIFVRKNDWDFMKVCIRHEIACCVWVFISFIFSTLLLSCYGIVQFIARYCLWKRLKWLDQKDDLKNISFSLKLKRCGSWFGKTFNLNLTQGFYLLMNSFEQNFFFPFFKKEFFVTRCLPGLKRNRTPPILFRIRLRDKRNFLLIIIIAFI